MKVYPSFALEDYCSYWSYLDKSETSILSKKPAYIESTCVGAVKNSRRKFVRDLSKFGCIQRKFVRDLSKFGCIRPKREYVKILAST
jgi:hypothetical protein